MSEVEGNFELIDAGSALSSMVGSEVEAQLTSAARYPKHSTPEHMRRFHNRVLAMVTASEEIAEDCLYSLKRKGKDEKGQSVEKIIEGPSIRFAECLTTAWGNLRVDSGISDIGDKYATTYGAVWDLETNVAERIVVKKRITYKTGHRYSEDMAVTAANAARSVAKREAVLKTIPRILWEPLFEAARKKAIGEATDLPVRRQKLAAHYQKLGVTLEQVLAKVGRMTLDEVTQEDLLTLRGIANAIKENETTVADEFATAAQEPQAQSSEEKTAAIVEQVRKNKEAAAGKTEPAAEKKDNGAPAADAKSPVT